VVVAGEELLAGDPAEHAVEERGDEGSGGFWAVEAAAGQDAAEDPPVVVAAQLGPQLGPAAGVATR